MKLQEMINSLDNLSKEDISFLFEIIRLKLSDLETDDQAKTRDNNDSFWDMTLKKSFTSWLI